MFVSSWYEFMRTHMSFAGPGIVAAVAYIDPGNWATDMQAGSSYGYAHLFIVLLSGLIALLFQILATRLGCVSGVDLATNCRMALYDRGRHKLLYRYGLLYPLYALTEAGIIFTDLAELIGTAIALNLLIPQLPLWAAVLLTSLDVFLVLLAFNQDTTKTVSATTRIFELGIGILVLVVFGSFVALLIRISPDWGDVFHGYIPSERIVSSGALYVAVGMIGATVMPHAFFIGSKLATFGRLELESISQEQKHTASRLSTLETDTASAFDAQPPSFLVPSENSTTLPVAEAEASPASSQSPSRSGILLHSCETPQSDSHRETKEIFVAPIPPEQHESQEKIQGVKPSPEQTATETIELGPMHNARTATFASEKRTQQYVKAHLTHSIVDVTLGLLCFAVTINSAILIMASQVFYYGNGIPQQERHDVSDLFDAFYIVKDYLGKGFAYLFAVALLTAGQSASLTVTLTGQIVSEGFINWAMKPWKRRVLTRMIGIVPSLVVSIAVGREGITTLLVASQVALSIVLSFVLIPLIVFTSSHSIMSVSTDASISSTPKDHSKRGTFLSVVSYPFQRHYTCEEGFASYANYPIIIYLCIALWILITIANLYALITL